MYMYKQMLLLKRKQWLWILSDLCNSLNWCRQFLLVNLWIMLLIFHVLPTSMCTVGLCFINHLRKCYLFNITTILSIVSIHYAINVYVWKVFALFWYTKKYLNSYSSTLHNQVNPFYGALFKELYGEKLLQIACQLHT